MQIGVPTGSGGVLLGRKTIEGAIGGLYASERSASEESLLSFGIDLFPTASV